MTLEADALVEIVMADPRDLDVRQRAMRQCVLDLRDGTLIPTGIIRSGLAENLDDIARLATDMQWRRGYLEIGELIDAEDTAVLPALDACTEAGA